MTNFKLTRLKLMASLLALAVLFNIASMGCGFKKPQAPSWLATWELPLINRAIELREILNRIDDSGIVYDSAGNPGIEIREALDTILVDENLSLATADFDIKDSVGIIEIEPPTSANTVTYLNQILPINIGYVPPVPFDHVQPVERFSSFSWAEVESGIMDFTFTNRLEVDLDTLVVAVIDSADLHTIGVLTYNNGLSYMESETQSLDISGQRISSAIFLSYHGHTPGGVLINAGDQYLSADITFPDTIEVSAAMAEILEIIRNSSETYEIEDSTKVYSSTISGGTITLDIFNGTDLPFNVTLRSPNFRKGGSEFRVLRRLGPDSFSRVLLDLAGYEFIPDDGFPNQTVVVAMTSVVNASAPDQYVFGAADSINVHVNIAEIRFASLDGRIAPHAITLDPVTRSLDLPDGLDEAFLTRGSVSLILCNNSMVPAFVDVIVQGGGKSLNIQGLIAAKGSPVAPPALTTLTASPEENARFLSPPPTELVILGSGTVNPNYEIVSLRPGDSFTGETILSSPLEFTIGDTVKIRPEIASLEIGDSRPEDFANDVNSGLVRATLENRLPLGTIATVYIGTRSDSSLYSDPATIILGPFVLTPAETDSRGLVVSPISSEFVDSLTGDELALFENDSLYIGETVDILPTGSSGVVVSGDAGVHLGASARLQIFMGDHD